MLLSGTPLAIYNIVYARWKKMTIDFKEIEYAPRWLFKPYNTIFNDHYR